MSAGPGDRLDRLYELLARSRAATQELEELIAEEEGAPTASLHQRRRHIMRVVA